MWVVATQNRAAQRPAIQTATSACIQSSSFAVLRLGARAAAACQRAVRGLLTATPARQQVHQPTRMMQQEAASRRLLPTTLMTAADTAPSHLVCRHRNQQEGQQVTLSQALRAAAVTATYTRPRAAIRAAGAAARPAAGGRAAQVAGCQAGASKLCWARQEARHSQDQTAAAAGLAALVLACWGCCSA